MERWQIAEQMHKNQEAIFGLAILRSNGKRSSTFVSLFCYSSGKPNAIGKSSNIELLHCPLLFKAEMEESMFSAVIKHRPSPLRGEAHLTGRAGKESEATISKNRYIKMEFIPITVKSNRCFR